MHTCSQRHKRGGLTWLVFLIFIQPIFAAECPDKTGTQPNVPSCQCGRIDCAENQYCKVGEALDEDALTFDAQGRFLTSARPDGTVFYGVNGQCADTSGGPWYVGIINGLCEDVPNRHTISSLASCEDAFGTGVLASVGVLTRLAYANTCGPHCGKRTPSMFGCDVHGDFHPHGGASVCEDSTDAPFRPGMCCGNVHPNFNYNGNFKKGCTVDRYGAYTLEFEKLGVNSPAGDPLMPWSAGRFTMCISAPVCSNVVSSKQMKKILEINSTDRK